MILAATIINNEVSFLTTDVKFYDDRGHNHDFFNDNEKNNDVSFKKRRYE